MGLDIRLPIGLLFLLLGLIITGYGVLGDPAVYTRSLGHNVNLWWGMALLAFGAVMLYFGRKGTSSFKPAELSPEGRAIEQMEHASGKEN